MELPLSTKKAAEYLGVSEATIRHHIYNVGDLKGVFIGHSLVFTKEELDASKAQWKESGRPVDESKPKMKRKRKVTKHL